MNRSAPTLRFCPTISSISTALHVLVSKKLSIALESQQHHRPPDAVYYGEPSHIAIAVRDNCASGGGAVFCAADGCQAPCCKRLGVSVTSIRNTLENFYENSGLEQLPTLLPSLLRATMPWSSQQRNWSLLRTRLRGPICQLGPSSGEGTYAGPRPSPEASGKLWAMPMCFHCSADEARFQNYPLRVVATDDANVGRGDRDLRRGFKSILENVDMALLRAEAIRPWTPHGSAAPSFCGRLLSQWT